jgi:hypothetical protein
VLRIGAIAMMVFRAGAALPGVADEIPAVPEQWD